MSKNGEDDAKIVKFEELTLEQEEGEEPSKLTEILSYLKEHLEPDQYTEVLAKFGVEDDLSNADLLEAFKELLKKPEEEEEEDEDDDAKKKKEAQDGEEDGEKPDRAAFMKECMAEGKTLEECTELFKEKYPDPEKKKEEGADTDEVPTALEKQMKELTDRITQLEGEKQLGEVSTEVEKLVTEKHLAPVQRKAIIKLAAGMDSEDRTELLDFFRSTQKISVHKDVGHQASDRAGAGGAVLDNARKKELIELHGIGPLIMDKADRSKKMPWEGDN